MEIHNPEMIEEESWEDLLDLLTADMDPEDIDVKVVADRYKEYIEQMQQFNLEVPAKAIRICAALLKVKTYAIDSEPVEYIDQEEDMGENPMDFEDEEEKTVEMETGPDLEIPVQPKPKRRMSKAELKNALKDALEVKERREERQEMREEIDHQFETEEETIKEKINSLYTRLTSVVNGDGKVRFNRLLEKQTSEEKIEKFMHVLTLENDRRVRCIQDEFLGDLHVQPEKEA